MDLYQIDVDRIEDQRAVLGGLDTKTGAVLGFIAISTGEILGFLILAAAEGYQSSRYFTNYVNWGVLGGMLASLTAFLLGVLALWPRTFCVGPEISREVEDPQNKIEDAFAEAQRKNRLLIRTKYRLMCACGLVVLIGVLCYTLAAVALYYRFMSGSDSSGGASAPLW